MTFVADKHESHRCNHTTCSAHRLDARYTFFQFVKEPTSETPLHAASQEVSHADPTIGRAYFSYLEHRTRAATPTTRTGGAGRDRTDDLRLAKPPLSQLSYSPPVSCRATNPLVGLVEFEPTTPALSRRCSNQLSYRPATPRGLWPEQPISCGYLITAASSLERR